MEGRRWESKSKSLIKTVRGKLKAIDDFVFHTPGFNPHSYGEIRFLHRANFATYSPFVTVDPGTSPQIVWQFLTKHWDLSVPTAAISLAGTFQKKDVTWRKVLDETWTFSSGSLPCQPGHSNNTCCVAIIPVSKLTNRKEFFSAKYQGSFPTLRRNGAAPRRSYCLDAYHTHFIFVDGDVDGTVQFRRNLLQFIGSIAVDVNQSATSFSTIPVVNVLVSENSESLKAVMNAGAHFPTVVADSANHMCELIKKNNLESESEPGQPTSETTSDLHNCNTATSDEMEQCINMWRMKSLTLVLFSTHTGAPARAILNVMMKLYPEESVKGRNAKAFSIRSIVHLGVAWDMMDMVRNLLRSWKQFEDEEHDLLGYLAIALTYDRAELIEHLEDLGVHSASSLTIHSLWTLYNESLYNERFMTATSSIVRKLLNNTLSFHETDLLHLIGRIISSITDYAVDNFYSDKIYKDYHPHSHSSTTKMLICSTSAYDESLTSPYPERDLFLWCMFFGKYKLAKVFWKHSNHLAALSLFAAAIVRGQIDAIGSASYNSSLIEELSEIENFWKNRTLSFLSRAFKGSRELTLSYLVKPFGVYGNCSTLNLAYATGQKEVVAHHAMQHSLDYVWLGNTKRDSPFWRTVLAICCPCFIPWLHLVQKDESKEQVERSPTYYKYDKRKQSLPWRIGAEITKEDYKGGKKRKQLRNFFTTHTELIHSYVNSPVIKFVYHLVFLCAASLCMCVTYATECGAIDRMATINSSVVDYNINDLWRSCTPITFILTTSYVFGVFVDEFRQFCMSGNSIRACARKWANSFWNRIDVVMIVTYTTGQLMYFFGRSNYLPYRLIIKTFFAISLFTMLMRFFQTYYVFRYVGPKVYMIKEMVKDLYVFMYIMVPMFVYYGVTLSCFLGNYSQYEFSSTMTQPEYVVLVVYNFVLRRPFWQIFGGAFEDADTLQNSIDQLAATMFTTVYLMFSVLLMTNLLIALFSYTFQQIQDNANVYWKYQRFEVVYEFWDRPLLPSPFIVLENLIIISLWYKKHKGNEKERNWRKMKSKNIENDKTEDDLENQEIFQFEKEVLQQFLTYENEKNNL